MQDTSEPIPSRASRVLVLATALTALLGGVELLANLLFFVVVNSGADLGLSDIGLFGYSRVVDLALCLWLGVPLIAGIMLVGLIAGTVAIVGAQTGRGRTVGTCVTLSLLGLGGIAISALGPVVGLLPILGAGLAWI